jgi:hypothetical protein
LTTASAEHRLEERLKPYGRPKLLVIDAIGDIPIDRHGAHLFCQLLSRRYERGAILLTSHYSAGQGADGFGDPIMATASLDRLRHHSHVLNIQGDSYRLQETQKAGRLKKAPLTDNLQPYGVGDFSVIAKSPFSIIVDRQTTAASHRRGAGLPGARLIDHEPRGACAWLGWRRGAVSLGRVPMAPGNGAGELAPWAISNGSFHSGASMSDVIHTLIGLASLLVAIIVGWGRLRGWWNSKAISQ